MAAPDLSGERDDIQGFVASGYGHLPHAAYLLFAINEPGAAGDWLARLADSVTTARGRVGTGTRHTPSRDVPGTRAGMAVSRSPISTPTRSSMRFPMT